MVDSQNDSEQRQAEKRQTGLPGRGAGEISRLAVIRQPEVRQMADSMSEMSTEVLQGRLGLSQVRQEISRVVIHRWSLR